MSNTGNVLKSTEMTKALKQARNLRRIRSRSRDSAQNRRQKVDTGLSYKLEDKHTHKKHLTLGSKLRSYMANPPNMQIDTITNRYVADVIRMDPEMLAPPQKPTGQEILWSEVWAQSYQNNLHRSTWGRGETAGRVTVDVQDTSPMQLRPPPTRVASSRLYAKQLQSTRSAAEVLQDIDKARMKRYLPGPGEYQPSDQVNFWEGILFGREGGIVCCYVWLAFLFVSSQVHQL
jgi:hypothetical protein